MPTPGACRPDLLGAFVLVLAVLLSGCGPTGTAAPSAASSGAGAAASSAVPTRSPSATPSSSPSAGSEEWDASGSSFGVDRAGWPETTAGVKKLLASLPKELGGNRLDLNISPQDPGPSAAYGKTDVVFTTSVDDMEGEYRAAAYQLVQVNFAMGSVCLENTQRGTIPVPDLGDVDEDYSFGEPEPGVREGSTPGWFSCRSRSGEEPGPLEQAQAVGWSSGKIAWQLYARDEKAARALISALHEAAGR